MSEEKKIEQEIERLKAESTLHSEALQIEVDAHDATRADNAALLERLRKLEAHLRSVTGDAAERLAHDMDHDNRNHSKWYAAVKRARKALEEKA